MSVVPRVLPRLTTGLLNTYQGIHRRAHMAFQRRMSIKRRSRLRRRGGFSATKRRKFGKKTVTSGRGLTSEYDKAFIYARKRMPWKKRRRWRNFTKKVHAVAEKELGTRTVLFNIGQSETNQTANNQGSLTFCLYGLQSTKSWLSDMQYIGDLENALDPTASTGNRVSDNGKMVFQSAVMDLTLRNISSKDGVIDNEATLETDIYEISMRKDAELGPNIFADMTDLLDSNNTAGIYDQNTSSLGTAIKIEQRGCTPFEKTKSLSTYGIKIWRKTKYFLKPGQTLTYQTRDPKRHAVYKNRILKSDAGFNYPGMTKILFVVFKAVPGITVGAGAGQTQEKVTWGVTRKYMYKVEGIQEDRSIRVIR